MGVFIAGGSDMATAATEHIHHFCTTNAAGTPACCWCIGSPCVKPSLTRRVGQALFWAHCNLGFVNSRRDK